MKLMNTLLNEIAENGHVRVVKNTKGFVRSLQFIDFKIDNIGEFSIETGMLLNTDELSKYDRFSHVEMVNSDTFTDLDSVYSTLCSIMALDIQGSEALKVVSLGKNKENKLNALKINNVLATALNLTPDDYRMIVLGGENTLLTCMLNKIDVNNEVSSTSSLGNLMYKVMVNIRDAKAIHRMANSNGLIASEAEELFMRFYCSDNKSIIDELRR